MTIGIDASRSIDTIQKTGVEKVSDELLRQFIEIKNQKSKIKNNDFDFIFYTPQSINWLPKENQKILRWPVKFFWTQVRLAWELIFHPPKAMFFPVHAMPVLLLIFFSFPLFHKKPWHRISLTTPARELATPPQGGGERTHYYKIIHDIAFKKQPQLYSFKPKMMLNLDLWLAKRLCAKIFVPSRAVKDDLLKYTKIKPEKIIVAHWGYNTKNTESTKTQKAQKQILYIGRVEGKKNIRNLIMGFELFNEKYPAYKLMLAGRIDPQFKISNVKFQMSNQISPFRGSPLNKLENFKLEIGGQNPNDKIVNHNSSFMIHDSIQFLGYISEEKKRQLLAESACLALVSEEEGFGFPILEAFDFGLPVVASDIPVLREIGGDACMYVNPDSPESIAQGLEMVLAETCRAVFLQEKIEKGRERLKKFSWQKTAEKIFREMLNG
ncbi:hypothetical protein A3H03_03355 [Candidatus Kuenenbacteria bacterium RIFCSPLOWO2_12_FULL_42_13]|uniref:Glycosyl transferase family 1 domain-containing protein n=2 Tax=Candidatus Kueneniibacteriota TaxID=1752740 RepID=A0A1F6G2T1_9BACT|nr:MAG: hypothetical protein A3H03_03355 [Candidatus Kuenenbacteria bacterium RIFCSPLOWO2_12_FULL_42_13]